jgi:ribonuclease HI
MGIGGVARNDFGTVVAAVAKVFPCRGDPMTAEVLGAWHAVKLGREVGYSRVILEGNSLAMVFALQQTTPCWSSVGQLIGDIRLGLQQFHSFSVNHVKREGNQAAHYLAKLAISQLLGRNALL